MPITGTTQSRIAQTYRISCDIYNNPLVCKLISIFCFDAYVTSVCQFFIHNHQIKERTQCISSIFVIIFYDLSAFPQRHIISSSQNGHSHQTTWYWLISVIWMRWFQCFKPIFREPKFLKRSIKKLRLDIVIKRHVHYLYLSNGFQQKTDGLLHLKISLMIQILNCQSGQPCKNEWYMQWEKKNYGLIMHFLSSTTPLPLKLLCSQKNLHWRKWCWEFLLVV